MDIIIENGRAYVDLYADEYECWLDELGPQNLEDRDENLDENGEESLDASDPEET